MVRSEKPERGLPSVNQARAQRRRAIVLGRVQLREAAPRLWLWFFVITAASAVVYWRYAEGQLNGQKSAVMAKQRAIASVLEPKVEPFRARIERWVLELSGKWPGDFVAPGATLDALAAKPGVYLRLLTKTADSPESIRKAAEGSVRDGFTACLLPQRSTVPAEPRGPSCKSPGDCNPGQVCDEYGICGPPGEPFNLRVAYRALRILSTKWSDELHDADNDLSVRIFERDLLKVSQSDVPLALDLLMRSKFFVVVLDDDPPAGLPDPIGDPTRKESDAERIQRVPHPARVGIWDLEQNAPLLRLLAQPEGRIVSVGERVVTDPVVVASEQRQINNCALALSVREAFEHRAPPP